MYDLLPMKHRFAPAYAFDPFREMEDMFRLENKMSTFSTDIIDKGDVFELNADLPGFTKDDINLEIENDCLTINAKHEQTEEDNKNNYIKRERFYGSYSRSFDLTGIDIDSIEAAYTDGVLKLTLPKKKEEIPEKKLLKIN